MRYLKKIKSILLVLILFLGLLSQPVFASSPVPIGTAGEYHGGGAAPSHTLSSFNADQGTGDNRCLIVITTNSANVDPDDVTWNGVSMEKIVNKTGAQRGGGDMFYVAAPSGTHDIVVTFSPNRTVSITAFLLKDCAQSSPVDTSVQGNISGATAISKSITTGVDNTIVIAWNLVPASGIFINFGLAEIQLYDSAGDEGYGVAWIEQTTAGARNTGFGWTGSQSSDIYAVSIKFEAAISGPANIATKNGVASASIATRNGVALAGIKSIGEVE